MFNSATNPSVAIEFGIHKYADQFEDKSEEGIKKIVEKCSQFQRRAKKLVSQYGDQMNARQNYSIKLMQREVGQCIKWKDHKGYLLPPVCDLRGLQTTLPNFFAAEQMQKLESFYLFEYYFDISDSNMLYFMKV